MRSLAVSWEKGRGYKLTIDGVAFEPLTTDFVIRARGARSPYVDLKMAGDRALELRGDAPDVETVYIIGQE